MTTTPRILEVRTRILKRNDELARDMRREFERAGVLVVNMVSSPGTGKTAFLKETLTRLAARGVASAAVVGPRLRSVGAERRHSGPEPDV